jgi:hypothetical protein
MPSEGKPHFRAEALRPKLVGFKLGHRVTETRKELGNWVNLLANKPAETKTARRRGREACAERELLPGFITDLFEKLLGFTGPASGDPTYTLKRKALIQIDGKHSDAALGRFAIGGDTGRGRAGSP